MYKRILVPVDGSATAMRGLKEAIGLASAHKARLLVLNVVDETLAVPAAYAAPAADIEPVLDSLWAYGTKVLDQATARAARRGVRIERSQVQSGLRAVSDVILDEAHRWRADLLVMGTHGRRGLSRALLGSDAERVLREAPVPVLLVRATDSVAERARAVATSPSSAKQAL